MLNVILADIMNDHPLKVKEGVDVGSVAHLLLRYRINGILVVSKDDDQKVTGILTTTDLLRLIDEALGRGAHRIEELKKASRVPVEQVATKDIIALDKNTPLLKVIALMHKRNIHTLPVYDQDKLIGVVGRHDILNVALA